MVEASRRDRVGLGLIGIGSSWEQVYREPLFHLRNRLKIRFVYDSVKARAKSVADELDAKVAGSLRQIMANPALQGLLFLDPGWCGTGALEMATVCGKPVFLGDPVLRQASKIVPCQISRIVETNCSDHNSPVNAQWMPELGHRFTPASCRFRELIATLIGPVKRIQVDCDIAAEINQTAAIVDWCNDIMGSVPSMPRTSLNGNAAAPEVVLDFPPDQIVGRKSSGIPRTAKLRQVANNVPRIEAECERGRATLVDRSRIIWETATASADESLVDERSELEILIDQFCRRALGGLNPIGRLAEFAQALETARSIQSHYAHVK